MSKPSPDPTRRSAILALAGAAMATPAHAQFGDLLKQALPQGLPQLPKLPTVAQPAPAQPARPAAQAGVQNLQPRGYSERFVPVRDLIAHGRYDDALQRFGASDAIVADPFLRNAETGVIDLEAGQSERAVTALRAAEDTLAPKTDANGRPVQKGLRDKIGASVGMVAGKVIGQEESTPYNPLDHELVLQLNYLSIAHLLQGDRRCYNVARRCMDRQAVLKLKFDKQIEDYKAKYAQQAGDPAKVATQDRTSLDDMAQQFKNYDGLAGRVPNAYVNPLGDYLSGVIQEIVSAEQPALRDNSRIAYVNAAKLCGGSRQLAAAAVAMARPRVPAGERVLHIVVGEGFSPTREVLTYGFSWRGQLLPIRRPIFTPVDSPIERVVLLSPNGSILAPLDPIGDFEAIRLRDQSDRVSEIMLGVVVSALASYGADSLLNKAGVIGSALGQAREASAAPDTRSWQALPRRFHVARLVVPANAASVRLASLAAGGRVLATQELALLPKETQSLVYARAVGSDIQVSAARRLWIDGGRLEETPA